MVSVRIPLTQGKFARVSIQDAERVRTVRWFATVISGHDYAVSNNGFCYLHRFILQPGDKEEVDHRDNDGLNCTRANMRVCSHAQNNQNKGLRADSKSGFKGVGWNAQKRKWQARISVEKRHVHLGFFDIKKEAARAYDRAALQLHGEYARTNESLGLLT